MLVIPKSFTWARGPKGGVDIIDKNLLLNKPDKNHINVIGQLEAPFTTTKNLKFCLSQQDNDTFTLTRR
ncbi:MAG TPA: hypothetical protein P5556_08060 [Candidatus Gastranaerophilales bacterium]|nr:hypothetical protein [Candidatus Gastranaerophilales bacterium]